MGRSRLQHGCGCLVAPPMMCCLGMFFIMFSFGELSRYFNSDDWVSTEGQITTSEVVTSTGSDGDINTHARVIYTFRVDGERYTGSHLQFGDSLVIANDDNAQQKVDDYPQGSIVTVYYNPHFPRESVLERRMSGALIGFLVAGAALMLLAPLVMVGLFLSFRGYLSRF